MTPDAEPKPPSNLRTMAGPRNKLILVVDSDQLSRELLREALEARGYIVIEAATGQQALDDVEGIRPDLVLMELYLPVLHGFTVARRLRSDPRFDQTKLVALSTMPYEDGASQALAAGFDRYLAKPTVLRQLLGIVEQVLQ